MGSSKFDEALAALAVKRDEYEVQRVAHDGQPQSGNLLRRAQLSYFAAMEHAIMASPHGNVVRNYAIAATTGVHQLCLLHHEVNTAGAAVATEEKLARVRTALQNWADAERDYVALGYRAVTLDELKKSTRILGMPEEAPQELFYGKVFVRRDEAEAPTLWGEAEVENFPAQEAALIEARANLAMDFNPTI